MANIFTKSIEEFEKPNKNTFNRSFTNNLTMRFGEFTPCFVKEVMPSQSVRIKPTFGFNLHPLVFPVQTKMRCNLHFFYVRNRPLWKGWMDFFGKTDNIDGDNTPPYIDFENIHDKLRAGSLFDNIGIPCTVAYSDERKYDMFFKATAFGNPSGDYGFIYLDAVYNKIDSNIFYTLLSGTRQSSTSASLNSYAVYVYKLTNDEYYPSEVIDRPISSIKLGYTDFQDMLGNTRFAQTITTNKTEFNIAIGSQSTGLKFSATIKYNNYFEIDLIQSHPDVKIIFNEDGTLANLIITGSLLNDYFVVKGNSYLKSNTIYTFDESLNETFDLANVQISGSGVYDLADLPLSRVPYYMESSNPSGIKVSALPLRAYEAIYNSFYRDERNNPLIIDGKEIYNQFIRNDSGGIDDRVVSSMYKANWMPDAYTTAVQTPQQGDLIPLVGVTATGLMTFEDENGKSYTLQANLADDGTLTGIQSHSSDMPTGTLRAMVDSISTGISINDFRNVNALQRWLEKNVRRGLRYKDIVETHFGNKIKYSEVDVPEFIGGVSRIVDINKVVQTSSDVPGSPLGTLAGIGNIFGDTDAVIQHYCDEPGWIIGIISVVPEPVYSQRLDKQLTKFSLLDYYFPEFAHIGYQPIFNQELTPLQLSNTDGKRALDVFGYQRPWHEYISSFDEVHGDFQTNMRDYLIQRVFGDVPQLSEEFLLVDRDIANAVFADKEDNAKIFGQIYFDFVTQIPIPKYGIPRLEA